MTPDRDSASPWPPEDERWPPVFPPEFVSAWGDDRYGLWIEVAIGDFRQRLRWIEPGEFMMGSPDDEPYRQDREGPRHKVRISRGFWLADTACSQAVWQAVMGSNPSEFKDDPQNPVENVSWHDVQDFLHRLHSLLKRQVESEGMKIDLPSEAEWEYACRAGTKSAFNFGDRISTEQANYDASVAYAGGPTGKWLQKTVPVKRYAPNAWGLYQMHGNVWEWCSDGQRQYDRSDQTDPRGPEGQAPRVVRGGSWFIVPWWLRSAFRDLRLRVYRSGDQGFRFSLRSTSQEEGAERPPEADEETVARDA